MSSPNDIVDPNNCPLCGEINGCGAQAGLSSCWCYDMEFDPELLKQIPPNAKGKACICRACAEGRVHPSALQNRIESLTKDR